jgi:ATP-dependent helicase/nuclease subunit B
MAACPTIYSIPPGVPFVDALAAGLLARTPDDPLALSATSILLPTRRACRALTEAFLRQSDGKALLLPRLMPIGDSDEAQSLLELDDEPGSPDALDISPAIPDLQRRLVLARLILSEGGIGGDERLSPARATRLADGLADLLDQVQTERLSFDGLESLVPDEYATHWQITLKFLKILTERWPGVVDSLGCLDPAARRNRLIEAQADAWSKLPPTGPVIAAGSTGSIPATASLLSVIASLPQGAVILPGLDMSLSADDGVALEATHPQYGLMRLLGRMEVAPGEVIPWTSDVQPACTQDRVQLISQALRPPLSKTPPAFIDTTAALTGVRLVTCPGPQEEAGVIALALRRALETPGRTAALITPDRQLARRVAAELGRWDIAIDDSAGQKLADTPVGAFLRLTAACIADNLAPVSLLALLKHPLSAAGHAVGEFRARVRRLELLVLRGPRPAAGFDGLHAALAASEDNQDLSEWLTVLEDAARPLTELMNAVGPLAVHELVAAHIAFAEELASAEDSTGPNRLWAGDDGEAAAAFLAELQDAIAIFPPIFGADYPAFLEVLMAGRPVRPRYGLHPRLHIWGLLEARLQQADLLCLGGLNEGTWPGELSSDPWMSRPMRTAFGLPPPERRIGLSAHDFVQAFCAGEILLTRADRVDGTPTVPARWLLRLNNALVGATGEDRRDWLAGATEGDDWLGWQAALDEPAKVQPVAAPAPTPPVSARPRRISVTQVETWMRDPYAIYARHILRLRPLDPIDSDPGAADRGTFIHAALDAFLRAHPDGPPENSLAALIKQGETAFGEALARPGVWAFWWPRFLRIADWFIQTERAYRASIGTSYAEVEGRMRFDAPAGPFELIAKADRVDRLTDGSISIVDYKTGGLPRTKEITLGFAPQLPLEAAMAENGAFRDVPAAEVSQLEFWRLTGGDPAGERKPAGKDIEALAAVALEGLKNLVARFDDPATAYLSQPDPEHATTYADFNHLARLQEWSSVGGGEA